MAGRDLLCSLLFNFTEVQVTNRRFIFPFDCCVYAISGLDRISGDGGVDERLRFALNLLQVVRSFEAFGIDLVNVFRA